MSLLFPFTTPVRGVSQYSAAVAQANTGDYAIVRHDPLNPYDANACEVIVNNELVGYLPALLAARLVHTAAQWEGQITEKFGGEHPGLRISVRGAVPSSNVNLNAISENAQPVDVLLPTPRTPSRLVAAHSGRILGSFIEELAGVIVVETPNGRVPYPSDLVVVAE